MRMFVIKGRRKLLSPGFLLDKLKSSLRKFSVATMTWLTDMEYLCHKWQRICSTWKNKQQSTKHTHKTKDRVTRTLPKTGVDLECSERVSNSCSTSDTRRVKLAANPVISHERGKDREVFTTSGTYPLRLLFVFLYFFLWLLCCLSFDLRILITSL
jgi:hypothetical protein